MKPQAGPTRVTRVSGGSYASQTDPRRSQAGPTRAPGGSYAGPRGSHAQILRGSHAGPTRVRMGSTPILRRFYAGFAGPTRLSRVLRASQASPTRVPGGPTACRASDPRVLQVLLVTWVGPLRRSQLCVESRKVEVSDTQNEDAPAGSRTRGTSMGGLYVAATLQVPLRLVIRLAWLSALPSSATADVFKQSPKWRGPWCAIRKHRVVSGWGIYWAWQDSNLQSLVPKTNALSISSRKFIEWTLENPKIVPLGSNMTLSVDIHRKDGYRICIFRIYGQHRYSALSDWLVFLISRFCDLIILDSYAYIVDEMLRHLNI